MTDKRTSPLERWSRLKRARTEKRYATDRAGAEPMAPDCTSPEPAPRAHDAPRDKPPRQGVVPAIDDHDRPPQLSSRAPQQPLADLPDLSTLTRESDFTPFLRPDVPEEIRRQALRILWRSDPLFANLDGLDIHDKDYSTIGTVSQVVHTAYRAGRGYLDAEEEAEGKQQRDTGTDGSGVDASPDIESSASDQDLLPDQDVGKAEVLVSSHEDKSE